MAKTKYSEPFRPITLRLPLRLIKQLRLESPKGVLSEGLFKVLRRYGYFNIKRTEYKK